ncbi:MAG: hypothetical protein KAV48_05560, partial [Methanomicrobia archaeon]|nr:hypothetical protein [Methanomicrobia archaeon]
GHDWLCLPEFDGIVNNGAYYIRGELRLNQIQFIGIEDKWAFIQGSSWVGTASSEEIIEMLKKLEGFYGEETPIYVGGLSLEDFIEMLEEEQ